MNQRRFYVYFLIHPLFSVPFYVGKGCDKRCHMHLTEAKKPTHRQINPLKCKIINQIQDMGLEVEIKKVRENLTEEEALTLEEQLIYQWKRFKDGGCLSNISEGGKKYISRHKHRRVYCYDVEGEYLETFASLLRAADGKCVHKSTICAALNGRTKTAGGFRWSYEKVEKLPTIVLNDHVSPVIQYTLCGDVIQTFNSIKEAARATNTPFTSIVECCSQTSRHSTTKGKFRWSYKDAPLKPLQKDKRFYEKKKVVSIDPHTHEETTYNTVKEAAALTAANVTGIIDCCAGRKQKSGGLFWRYEIVSS